MKRPRNRMETERETRTEENHSTQKIWPGADVDYNPSICPNCGSARNHVVKTFAIIPTSDGGVVQRHHDCSNCGMRFRTAQRIPPCDVAHHRTTK